MTFNELQKSLEILGLYDRVTMKQVKSRHRELVKRYHPDSGETAGGEQIQLINAAYRILSEYLESYCFSFSEEEFYSQNPEERMRLQFIDNALWGGSREQRGKN
ncbi:MAG: J domain-containing protein [Geobacteraceae bacterium]|jgi:DnaJ-class molecular chaperone|nr:J domain-containing protein [Geobacteraceae bacterium]NTW81694.1 J domain-containing protein [Geobacteraceae bacterium]